MVFPALKVDQTQIHFKLPSRRTSQMNNTNAQSCSEYWDEHQFRHSCRIYRCEINVIWIHDLSNEASRFTTQSEISLFYCQCWTLDFFFMFAQSEFRECAYRSRNLLEMCYLWVQPWSKLRLTKLIIASKHINNQLKSTAIFLNSKKTVFHVFV